MDGMLPNPERVRLSLHAAARSELSRALWGFGEYVGPREKGSSRSHAQKEDFCMRRLIVAMAEARTLAFPISVLAPAQAEQGAWPDYVVRDEGNGLSFGVEVTEAGSPTWQRWLAEPSDGAARLYPRAAGCEGDAPERGLVMDLIEAVSRKAEKAARAYKAVSRCDLLIYENSEFGIFVDQDLHDLLDTYAPGFGNSNTAKSFTHVHIILSNRVYLDVFGPTARSVDLSAHYDIDFVRWTMEQSSALRGEARSSLDADHVAEEIEDLGKAERRALTSHLVNLYLHWLKWDVQKDRRSRSWLLSIINAQTAALEIITKSPSLNPKYEEDVTQSALLLAVFSEAVDKASVQTGLPPSAFPPKPPFTLPELLELPRPELELAKPTFRSRRYIRGVSKKP